MAMHEARYSRGTGQGIGLSGHINAYSNTATLVGNWSEEKFGRQLDAMPPSSHVSGFATEASRFQPPDLGSVDPRADPAFGQTASALFAHGPPAEAGRRYLTTVSELVFTDPATRAYGQLSPTRVAKQLWAGSKQNDVHVPVDATHTRAELTASKRDGWAAATGRLGAHTVGMDGTTAAEIGAGAVAAGSLAASLRAPAAGVNPFEPPKPVVSHGRKSARFNEPSAFMLQR